MEFRDVVRIGVEKGHRELVTPNEGRLLGGRGKGRGGRGRGEEEGWEEGRAGGTWRESCGNRTVDGLRAEMRCKTFAFARLLRAFVPGTYAM